MEFASSTFLFVFLPAVFLLYAVLKANKLRSILLIAAGLVFYAWGEPLYVLLMLFSTAFNYAMGLLVGREGGRKKLWLIVSVVFNVAMLAVFKYSAFAVRSINAAFGASIPVPDIASPLGISFFTFQALGYVIDVYRGTIERECSFLKVLLFISFFPQILQGPIIRYGEIEPQLAKHSISVEGVSEGMRLFILGLGMKPPAPEWGAMLSEAREFMRTAPHMLIFPALAIVLTASAINLLGDGLRDALDPHLRS